MTDSSGFTQDFNEEYRPTFDIVSVNDGGYMGVCQRCKRHFIGAKRQLYCSYCGQIEALSKENTTLKAQIQIKNTIIHELVTNLCFYYGMCRAMHIELNDGLEKDMHIKTPKEMLNKTLENLVAFEKITKDEYEKEKW